MARIAAIAALLALCVAGAAGDVTFDDACDRPRCRAGRPVRNPAHTPAFNGCGVPGFMVASPQYDMTRCCNAHDVCYDDCGNSRSKCDADFLACMQKLCDDGWAGKQREECRGTASVFHMGTALMGCAAYQASQRNACLCLETVGGDGDAEAPEDDDAAKDDQTIALESIMKVLKPADADSWENREEVDMDAAAEGDYPSADGDPDLETGEEHVHGTHTHEPPREPVDEFDFVLQPPPPPDGPDPVPDWPKVSLDDPPKPPPPPPLPIEEEYDGPLNFADDVEPDGDEPEEGYEEVEIDFGRPGDYPDGEGEEDDVDEDPEEDDSYGIPDREEL
ncbi:group XII secretory phospholipase A2 precursor-domain-containing protein [Hyaloraphidium curvatum]|nr:group XII secretory phospholipase A2 precursor-domain-containing protein [Hyaloraphidium curvatum]